MTAEQNKIIMSRVIAEAFNKGNYSVLREHFKPNFIEHQFGLHPTIEGMQADIQSLRAVFPDLNLTIEDMVADGDKVWTRSIARGTNSVGFMGPPNGKAFEIVVFDLCRFEDGMIVEHWGSPDRFEQMAQLGLLPQLKVNPALPAH